MVLPGKDTLNFLEAQNPELFITVISSVAVTLNVLGFTKHGIFQTPITTSSDRTPVTATQPLPDTPFTVVVALPTGSLKRGQCYVRVYMRFAGVSVAILTSDYKFNAYDVSYPQGPLRDSLEGSGVIRSIAGTDPAANTQISEAVPTNARWKLRSMRFVLVTDANTATRRVRVIVDNGTTTLFEREFGATQALSLTRTYEVHAGHKADDTAFDNNNVARIYIPEEMLSLAEAYRIRTAVDNIQAGDNFGAPQIKVEEWIEV